MKVKKENVFSKRFFSGLQLQKKRATRKGSSLFYLFIAP
jgi:hypothetical protein